jgi:hypothetical protein
MYVFVAQSPALLVADAPSSPLAEILNLDKQPLEPTTNKPANPVTANLPVLVTEEFTTISSKIEVSIKEQDSPTSLPNTPLLHIKTPPSFPCISHSEGYGGTSTILIHLKFSTLQAHKKKLLLHDPTLIASSMATVRSKNVIILVVHVDLGVLEYFIPG